MKKKNVYPVKDVKTIRRYVVKCINKAVLGKSYKKLLNELNLTSSTKAAFTLAEVLITLAVIGIVAALLIPNIIQQYKKQEASARLKKFVSMMQQAVALSEIDNGSVFTWTREDNIKDEDNNTDIAANGREAKRYFEKYLKPYIKYDKIVTQEVADQEAIVYFLDGSSMRFHNGGCLDIHYDVNGEKSPNTLGKDIFSFDLCSDKAQAARYLGSEKEYFGAYWQAYMTSRQDALEQCSQGAQHCSTLLKYDNWEFKDDYPYKL